MAKVAKAALVGVFGVTCVLAQGPAQIPAPAPMISANDLVRQAVMMELQHNADQKERLMYRMRRVTPEKTEVKQYVETDDGTVARLLTLNDGPLSADLAQKEDARLQNLAAHPEQQRDKQKKQKEDEERATKMVGALPDAFNYEYDGTEESPQGELLRLKFTPNPQYVAPTRELRVYEGMQGQMWLRKQDHRLARLSATLFRDVDFGWGILGRLYKGGTFEVVQGEIGAGRWETTHLKLSFEGKALLIKAIHIKEDETLSCFRQVAENLTVAQGVEMLRKYDPNSERGMVAQTQGAPPSAQPRR